MEDYSVHWNARIASSLTALAAYTCVVKTDAGDYVVATKANRDALGGRRSAGIAKTTADSINRSFAFQFCGVIPAKTVPTVGPGDEGELVHVNDDGLLERGDGDDVIGRADSAGNVYCLFGGAASGSGGATPGGSDGAVQVNKSGVLDGVAPGPAGNVLKSTGTSWDSAPPGGPSGAAGGDLSGTYPNPTVAKLNGASVPAAGALTTGAVLRATGPSATGYGAVDLANANAVTGTLPKTNQAAQDMGGDCSGTTATCTVGKVNGVSYPSGATTVGTVPRVTAANTVAYGALDLASANARTGTLPIGNGGTGQTSFAAGVIKSNGSALSSSAVVNSDVSATAGIAGTKIVPDFGSQDVATIGKGTFGGDVDVGGTFSIGGKDDGIAFERFGLGQMTSNDRHVINSPSTLTKTSREDYVDEKVSVGTENVEFGLAAPDGGTSIYNVRVVATKSDLSADDGWVGMIKIRRDGVTIVESGKTVTRLGSSAWTVDIGSFSSAGCIVRCNGVAGVGWSCEISRLTRKA